jgi:hypothetical protein
MGLLRATLFLPMDNKILLVVDDGVLDPVRAAVQTPLVGDVWTHSQLNRL